MSKLRLDTITKKTKITKNGKRYWFSRVAPNGEKLPPSQMYRSRSGRDKAVKRIQERENVIVENA